MNLPDLDSVNEEQPAPSLSKVITDLAAYLRDIWILEVRQQHLRQYARPSNYLPGPSLDGGRDAMGRHHHPIWSRLAEFVYKNHFNPKYFIKAQFENCQGNPPKSPSMILGPRAILRYRDFINNREVERDLELARAAQIRYAQSAVDSSKRLYGPGITAYRAIILDQHAPLSALFRYSLAVSCGDKDLIWLWFQPALSQYMYESEAYDEIWGDLIPNELKQEAMRISHEANTNC